MARINGVRHAYLKVGEYYDNAGGGTYYCAECLDSDAYVMVNAASGWTFTAHVITKYSDGTIEWDYSTDGRFA